MYACNILKIVKIMGTITTILSSKWFWIIVIASLAVVITPLLYILFVLYLPPPFNTIATIGIFIAWGFVAAYKDWIMSKRREEKQKS